MRNIVCCTGVFLLIVQSFSGFLFAQETIPLVIESPIPISDSPSLSGEIQGDIFLEEVELGDILGEGAIGAENTTSIPFTGDVDIEDTEYELPLFSGEAMTGVIIQGEGTGENRSGGIQTGAILLGESGANLLITEVYFAGTDERFELYNASDTAFVGDIQILGVKSSPLNISNITIPGKAARIFGDTMLMIADSSIIERSSLGLSMTDTNPLDISLLYSGNTIDTFIAPADLMQSAKDQKASLQKKSDTSEIMISLPSQNYNNIDTFIINPGIVYSAIYQTPPAECENRGTSLYITEIFPGSGDIYPPYIELFSPGPISQTITISGTMLSEPFDVFIDQPAGHYYIATTTDNGYSIHPYRSDNQKLSFSSGLGNIAIYGQSGQVLDKVDILVMKDGYASYIHGLGCDRVADSIELFSPGFPRDYLSYFPQGVEKIITVTEQVVIHTTGSISCSGELNTGTITAIATGDFVIEFTSIDYDPPGSDTNRESITIRSLVDYPLDLSLYALRLNTRNGLQYLWGILEPEEEITLTDNFRFPNAGACVELLYGDFVVDSYCYPQGIGSGETENDYSDISITIDNLIYDPPGDDTNNEQITFTVNSGSINFADGFYLLINGRKYNLTIFDGQYTGTFTLTANYRMPNTKDACISLMQGDFIFDTKCYAVPISTYTPSKKEESQHTERFDYNISILDIDYNPDGLDTNNEKITLRMESGGLVDLSKFYIQINGNKKKLTDSLSSGQTLTLIGTYGFPNTKQSCVSLSYQEHIYDTYCYDPIEKKEQERQTGDMQELYSGVSIEIRSVLPNPLGADTKKEKITILLHNPATIDLSRGFGLMINGTKKKLSGIIASGEEFVLSGSFTLPNTASCLSLVYENTTLDAFCYPQAKEGVTYTKNQETLLDLDDGDLGLLHKATLNKFDNKICLMISDIIIKCRKIPASKLAKKQYEELKLSRNYIALMHDYLYQNWKSFYFTTDIFTYKTIFEGAKKDIGDYKYTRTFGSENIPVSDIQARFQLQYKQPFVQQLETKLSTTIFGERLKQNYQKAKKRYYSIK